MFSFKDGRRGYFWGLVLINSFHPAGNYKLAIETVEQGMKCDVNGVVLVSFF